jgi:hypothetical protein
MTMSNWIKNANQVVHKILSVVTGVFWITVVVGVFIQSQYITDILIVPLGLLTFVFGVHTAFAYKDLMGIKGFLWKERTPTTVIPLSILSVIWGIVLIDNTISSPPMFLRL